MASVPCPVCSLDFSYLDPVQFIALVRSHCKTAHPAFDLDGWLQGRLDDLAIADHPDLSDLDDDNP